MLIAKEGRLFVQAKTSFFKKSFLFEAIVFGLILLGIILSIVLLNRGEGEKAHYAEVVYKGQVVYSLSLREDKSVDLAVEDGLMTIEVKEGKIAVTSSPCPNQYCVGQRYLDKAGSSIICAHEGVLITLRSDKPVGEISI